MARKDADRTPTLDDLPKWAKAVREYFGVYMSHQRAIDWLAFWEEEGLRVNNTSEILEAIKFARRQNAQRKDGREWMEQIAMWIRWYRKEQAANRRGGAYSVDTPEGFLNAVWGRMLDAQTHLDRWNIICSPEHYCGFPRCTTLDECKYLESRARERWKDWRRPTQEELEGGQEVGADDYAGVA